MVGLQSVGRLWEKREHVDGGGDVVEYAGCETILVFETGMVEVEDIAHFDTGIDLTGRVEAAGEVQVVCPM